MKEKSTFLALFLQILVLPIFLAPFAASEPQDITATYGKGDQANYGLATKFLEFMSSPEGQKICGEYGKARFGMPLYNDAQYAEKWDK